jgi:hypothetical protein
VLLVQVLTIVAGCSLAAVSFPFGRLCYLMSPNDGVYSGKLHALTCAIAALGESRNVAAKVEQTQDSSFSLEGNMYLAKWDV